ncbi:Helix-turn-helix [Actinobaculum suis]|uniref:Helix-turn-helix n=1 Tax=Actinobaculum suis TaxID=1657 RepID=A0A7Z8Y9J3_9ACTO|nr:helix-turn-helix transcriptional regulator [Actinobaculum suis]VDG76198.1 Helix-turn-helix [Actinobaculum suis]
MDVSAEIRAEMARQGVTVTEVAAAANVSRNWLSSRINGRVAIRLDDLGLVSQALNIPAYEFVRRASENRRCEAKAA